MSSQLVGRRGRSSGLRSSDHGQGRWRHILRYARWSQSAQLGRRALGLSVWRESDFASTLSAEDVNRLSDLALKALCDSPIEASTSRAASSTFSRLR